MNRIEGTCQPGSQRTAVYRSRSCRVEKLVNCFSGLKSNIENDDDDSPVLKPSSMSATVSPERSISPQVHTWQCDRPVSSSSAGINLNLLLPTSSEDSSVELPVSMDSHRIHWSHINSDQHRSDAPLDSRSNSPELPSSATSKQSSVDVTLSSNVSASKETKNSGTLDLPTYTVRIESMFASIRNVFSRCLDNIHAKTSDFNVVKTDSLNKTSTETYKQLCQKLSMDNRASSSKTEPSPIESPSSSTLKMAPNGKLDLPAEADKLQGLSFLLDEQCNTGEVQRLVQAVTAATVREAEIEAAERRRRETCSLAGFRHLALRKRKLGWYNPTYLSRQRLCVPVVRDINVRHSSNSDCKVCTCRDKPVLSLDAFTNRRVLFNSACSSPNPEYVWINPSDTMLTRTMLSESQSAVRMNEFDSNSSFYQNRTYSQLETTFSCTAKLDSPITGSNDKHNCARCGRPLKDSSSVSIIPFNSTVRNLQNPLEWVKPERYLDYVISNEHNIDPHIAVLEQIHSFACCQDNVDPIPTQFTTARGRLHRSLSVALLDDNFQHDFHEREFCPTSKSRWPIVKRSSSWPPNSADYVVHGSPSGSSSSHTTTDDSISERYPDYEFNIPFRDIKLTECIGKGNRKSIYKGRWHGAVVVHIFDNLTREEEIRFRRDVMRLMMTRHENIALFMGACIEPPTFAIVTSACIGISLYEKLRFEHEKLSRRFPLYVLQQVANALDYLHSRMEPIVVRHLNSRNIFLQPKVILCLTDHASMECNYQTPGCIPVSCESIRYIAPEILDLLNDTKTINFLRLLGSTSSFSPDDPISCIVQNPGLLSLHLSDKDFKNGLCSAQLHHSSSSKQLSSRLHSRSPSAERRHVSAPIANRSTMYKHCDVETDTNLAGLSTKSLIMTKFAKENEHLEYQQNSSNYQNVGPPCGRTGGNTLLMEHCKRERFSPKITLFLNEDWFNETTDVYAFGTIIFEVHTRKYPFQNLDLISYMTGIRAGDRDEKPVRCFFPEATKMLMLSCWAQSPALRPTMEQITQELMHSHLLYGRQQSDPINTHWF
ncbi:hypothetical protein EG68_04076 [Paragonimus skrjabini miyazakii]|uniref:Protein kinase domain-containing protein n=1 Tax=Paragonimus skrjabini miyazakii TaxID=59628 RepID=A0A8S9Z5V0_9TREM|nr:hypothetical protein EG68_04076 [Paragonimus skrjabini miyazakii]